MTSHALVGGTGLLLVRVPRAAPRRPPCRRRRSTVVVTLGSRSGAHDLTGILGRGQTLDDALVQLPGDFHGAMSTRCGPASSSVSLRPVALPGAAELASARAVLYRVPDRVR